MITSLTASNQCGQQHNFSSLSLWTSTHLLVSTSHLDGTVLSTTAMSTELSPGALKGSEHFSPSPLYQYASLWTPWVSSVFHGASQSSSRPGLGLSCTANTAGMDKGLHECYHFIESTKQNKTKKSVFFFSISLTCAFPFSVFKQPNYSILV